MCVCLHARIEIKRGRERDASMNYGEKEGKISRSQNVMALIRASFGQRPQTEEFPWIILRCEYICPFSTAYLISITVTKTIKPRRPTKRPHVDGMNARWVDTSLIPLTLTCYSRKRDWLTDQRIDRPSYKDARMHLVSLVYLARIC